VRDLNFWLITDQLDAPRMIAERAGQLEGVKRSAYLPFGEQIQVGVGGRATTQGYVAESVRQGFTGYEEDSETSLDFAQARYFSSGQGRFTSVDPLLASGNPVNPKTWNRYAYTLNNPLRYVDPTGLYAVYMNNGAGPAGDRSLGAAVPVEAPPDGWNPVDGRAIYDAYLGGQRDNLEIENSQEINSSIVERQNGNLTDEATDAALADLFTTGSDSPYNIVRGASAVRATFDGANHYKFTEDGLLFQMHIYATQRGIGTTSVFVPSQFDKVEFIGGS
jgi:RHS repeat-associated protein